MGKFLLVIGIIALLTFVALRGQINEIRYVALGDSYTAGTGIGESQSWPKLLVNDLTKNGIKIRLVASLAVNGKATREIISEQLPQLEKLNPDFITLLVGANDVNRGYSRDSFTKNLDIILKRLSGKKILLITIPDFSKTQTGKTFGDPKFNSQKINDFNQIIKIGGQKRNIPVVEIAETFLIGSDGLHPTAQEYQNWEKQIFPVVYDLLKR